MIDIRITEEDVREWRARRQDLLKEVAELDRKLELVELLTNQSNNGQIASLPGIEVDFSGLGKPEKILTILREKNEYLSPREIKNALEMRGETQDTWSDKFIYVHQVLKRLVDQGRIIKGKNKKYRAST